MTDSDHDYSDTTISAFLRGEFLRGKGLADGQDTLFDLIRRRIGALYPGASVSVQVAGMLDSDLEVQVGEIGPARFTAVHRRQIELILRDVIDAFTRGGDPAMAPDIPPASVIHAVVVGEKLRLALQDEMSQAPSAAHHAAVVTEMMMLYGQAFRNVYDAGMGPSSPGPLTDRVMAECILGLAVYKVWLHMGTTVDARWERDAIADHWRNVTGMALGEDE